MEERVMSTHDEDGNQEHGHLPGISKDDVVFDAENPNRARAVESGHGDTVLERAREGAVRSSGTYPDIVEGSDSLRTGTNWGVDASEDAETVETPRGVVAEGTEAGEAHPNRNTGAVLSRDDLEDVGSWSTIDTDDSAGSPSGNS
jgi:hypothetical protein